MKKYIKNNHKIYDFSLFRIKFKIKPWIIQQTPGSIAEQNQWDLKALNKPKLVAFVVPQNLIMCGGIMSIFSLCNASRKILKDKADCIIVTAPGKFTYSHNPFFLNTEKIYRWEQVTELLKTKKDVLLHITEIGCVSFYQSLTDKDKKLLKTIPDFQINILNQRNDIMPSPDVVRYWLHPLTPNVTMTTAHPNYNTQKNSDKYQIPCHLFHVHLDMTLYKSLKWEKKEKLILIDPDNEKYPKRLIKYIHKYLPDYKIKIIQNLSFTEYMKLAAKSMFSFSTAEGFDGWIVHPLFVGSLGMAVYNEEYFPSEEWKHDKNIYSSWLELFKNFVKDIRYFETHKDEYYKLIDKQLKRIKEIYNYDKYIDNITRFYEKKYDFLPKTKPAEFKHVKISGIQTVIPNNCINIDDEIKFYNDDEKLLNRNKKILGLGTRYIVEEGTTNNDLCTAAAEKLIQKLGIDINEIDTLVVSSTSHDYTYPASACIIQDKLGLREDCACFDLSGLACSAYVYALRTCFSLVESGASQKCLLLVGDTVSLHSDKRNRNSNMLFGDAATATLIEFSPEQTFSYFKLGSRGKDWNKIMAPAGGWKLPIRKDIVDIEEVDERGNVWHLYDEIMKGMDVFKFTMDVGPKGISDIIDYADMTIEDIDFVALHQANKQIVENVAKLAKLPKDKYSSETFTKYANCGSAAVATNICDQLKDKKVKNVVLATFGVGLSYAFALLDLSKTKIFGFDKYIQKTKPYTREELIQNWIKYFKGEIDDFKG